MNEQTPSADVNSMNDEAFFQHHELMIEKAVEVLQIPSMSKSLVESATQFLVHSFDAMSVEVLKRAYTYSITDTVETILPPQKVETSTQVEKELMSTSTTPQDVAPKDKWARLKAAQEAMVE